MHLRPIDPTPAKLPLLSQRLREAELRASDLDWGGDPDAAARARQQAAHFRDRINKGELYDPPF